MARILGILTRADKARTTEGTNVGIQTCHLPATKLILSFKPWTFGERRFHTWLCLALCYPCP